MKRIKPGQPKTERFVVEVVVVCVGGGGHLYGRVCLRFFN